MTRESDDAELVALAAVVTHDAMLIYAYTQQYGQMMNAPDRVRAERDAVVAEVRQLGIVYHDDGVVPGLRNERAERAEAALREAREMGSQAEMRANDLVEQLRAVCDAVLACETHHDERGHAYLKVPARSIHDLAAQISQLRAALASAADAPLEPRSDYDSGLCCMRDHANATPPWTCSCPCHTRAEPPEDAEV